MLLANFKANPVTLAVRIFNVPMTSNPAPFQAWVIPEYPLPETTLSSVTQIIGRFLF